MCGIAGVLSPNSLKLASSISMGRAIRHRGPDAFSEWHDQASGIALVHARLSILDTSSAGHQPMTSACGRYVLCYNGEIYNHRELRKTLSSSDTAYIWVGHSDTETLLACFSAWGVRETLRAAVGMFALALWDKHEKRLTLARDRLGEKPLYWGWQDGALIFASEIKAIKKYDSFSADIDRKSIALLMRYGYIPAPYSIYQGINKLPSGSYIDFELKADLANSSPQQYWSLEDTIEKAHRERFVGSDDEAVDELEQRLLESVRGQMLSDVSLGAFLSGGVDSSLVVALMQKLSPQPVRTFSIGFDDPRFNEANHAAEVARYLGTDHSELYVSDDNLLNTIKDLPKIYCEPFADSSQLPMLAVAKLAKENVTVVLSGDGGDELFGGYNPYRFAPLIWRLIKSIPAPLRSLSGAILGKISFGKKLDKLARVMSAKNQYEFYQDLISHWSNPLNIVLGVDEEAETAISEDSKLRKILGFQEWMMATETRMYMPDDILVKVDRASMAHSLEVRVPLLDHRLVQFAWSLSDGLRIKGGVGKWILKQVLYRYIPKEIIDRPKKGFSVPLGNWLRGPLRPWAEELLSEERIACEGYLNAKAVRHVWHEHLDGHRDNSRMLWCVLMFQAWLSNEKS